MVTGRKVPMCTQDYVPIIDIKDGTIITDDGRFIKILEIEPTNLAMKTKEEREQLYSNYYALLKSAPSEFSIKCTTEQTPVDSYTESLDDAIKREKNDGCRDLTLAHKKDAQTFSTFHSITHKQRFIFQYEAENDLYRSLTEQEKLNSLAITEQALIADFAAVGNSVKRSDDQDIELCRFLYNHYNRRLVNLEPFENRVARIREDAYMSKRIAGTEGEPKVYIGDLVGSRSFNSKESNDYILVDGLYCSYFYIHKNRYPEIMETNGWLSELITYGYGYEVDLFFKRKDTTDEIKNIRTRSRRTRIKSNDRTAESMDAEQIASSLGAMEYLRDKLKNEHEDLYDMCVLVSVYANTKEELYRKKVSLLRFADREDVGLIECKDIEEDGYISSAPLNKISDRLFKYSRHNLTTSAVTAAYPFTAFSLVDKGGIMLGTHLHNSSLVIYNPFDHRKYSNSNMILLGAPGKGKTVTLLSLTTRFRMLGIQNFIISPDKQDEFLNVCREIGGEFIDVSASASTRVNPFDIWPVTSESDKEFFHKQGNETSWLIEKIDQLGTWLELMVPGLTMEQKVHLREAIHSMYQKKGITADNSSIYKDAAQTQKKEMPTYSDFVAELRANPVQSSGIIAIFSQFCGNGVYKNLDGQTNVDLDNKYIVFGMEYLSKEFKAPMMFIVLQFIWAVARADKLKNKVVAIDEGSLLVDGKVPQMGDFVVEIFRMIRGFGGSAIFATQSIADLYKNNNEFGNTILSCAHSKILLGMETSDIRLIQKELELSSAETRQIRDFNESGQALLCAGASHVPIKIRISKDELRIFSTSAAERRQFQKERK